jgi:PD-(D/E)XK nuclease superfamily protein
MDVMEETLNQVKRPHHTKDKGDLGVAKAYCDLVEKGYLVLFPSTEHAPFDLVSYDGNNFVRIQVKYRRAVRGVLQINLINWWADKNGSHGKQVDKKQVDVVCVYCPDTDKCYYFKCVDVNVSVSLRVDTPKNNQSKNVRFAEDYTRVP